MKRLMLAALVLAAACGERQETPASAVVRRSGAVGLINPLLDVESANEFKELRPFKHKVMKLVEDAKKRGDATHVSVYFRDLNNGPLFGFDEKEKFSPASLLKVPIMIAVLKRAEKEPALLQRRLRYEREHIASPLVSTRTLAAGRDYTVDELLRAMIASSDNGAAVMMLDLLGMEAMDEVYRDLGITIPEVRGPQDSMSVREYGAFFRMLYNAGYLDKAMSQRALEHLAASEYRDGLAGGVPRGVTTAHKFGERQLDGGVRQLHDCGIVYEPGKPYLLCVMTRGRDFDRLASVVREISRVVFSEIDGRR